MAARTALDRDGHPWRVYPNGRLLCAAGEPPHYAFDAENKETDGACDCVNRKGATIASYVLTSKGLKRTS